ncbi:unnamed protein product [Enterobius vermicularis]|uniref:Uncharacterized protein n=1 Tax=Enterobius vermicularis TaxID=51028 RepID=A0A0N4V874_ENTVE|nr:unnamed protein product [Enterobius vermicularis]
MDLASENGDGGIVEVLLEERATLQQKPKKSIRWSPYSVFATLGEKNFMIPFGLVTALHIVSEEEQAEVVKMLPEKRAIITAESDQKVYLWTGAFRKRGRLVPKVAFLC